MDSKQEILLKNNKNKRLSKFSYVMQFVSVFTLGFSMMISVMFFVGFIICITSNIPFEFKYGLHTMLFFFGSAIGSGIISGILLSFFGKYVNDTRSVKYSQPPVTLVTGL